jgi:hypothetical protein
MAWGGVHFHDAMAGEHGTSCKNAMSSARTLRFRLSSKNGRIDFKRIDGAKHTIGHNNIPTLQSNDVANAYDRAWSCFFTGGCDNTSSNIEIEVCSFDRSMGAIFLNNGYGNVGAHYGDHAKRIIEEPNIAVNGPCAGESANEDGIQKIEHRKGIAEEDCDQYRHVQSYHCSGQERESRNHKMGITME